jgi:hypothetical protein
MRRMIDFDCAGDMLVGTLDEGEGTTGLLIVSGGNEIRSDDGGALRENGRPRIPIRPARDWR